MVSDADQTKIKEPCLSEKGEEQDDQSVIVPPDDDSIPDGGLVAWLQVLGSFMIFFNTWGVVNSFGVYQTYYENNFLQSEGASRISWIGSIQGFLLMSSGTFAGPLFDLGYYRYLLVIGLILSVLGVMMTSIASEYWEIMLAQAVCLGLGGGCLFLPGVAIPSTYFANKRSLALGISTSGSSFGAVIYSIVFHRLVDRIGFGNTTRVIGYIMLGTTLISVTVMRTRVTPTVKRSLFAANALKEPPFLFFSLALFVGFLTLYVPFYYISSYGITKIGMSPQLGFYLVPILNAGSVFGRLAPNYFADKIGPLNILIPFTSFCMILAFAWMGIFNTPGIIVFAVLYGMTSGTYVSLPAPTVTSLTQDLHHVGSRLGTCFLFGAIGILIGNPIAGALVNLEQKSFWKAQVFCGIGVFTAVVCLVLARLTKTGWAMMVKA